MYLTQGKKNDSIRTLNVQDTKDKFKSTIDDSFILFQLTTTYIEPQTGKVNKNRRRMQENEMIDILDDEEVSPDS